MDNYLASTAMNQIDATDAKLATHEEICALRYEAIQKSFESGGKRMSRIEYILYALITGKIDVWNKIKARQAEMDRDDAKEISALKAEEKKAKEKADEMIEIALVIAVVCFLMFFAFVGVNELIDFCQKTRGCV